MGGSLLEVGDLEGEMERRIEDLKELIIEVSVVKAGLPVQRVEERKRRKGSY